MHDLLSKKRQTEKHLKEFRISRYRLWVHVSCTYISRAMIFIAITASSFRRRTARKKIECALQLLPYTVSKNVIYFIVIITLRLLLWKWVVLCSTKIVSSSKIHPTKHHKYTCIYSVRENIEYHSFS